MSLEIVYSTSEFYCKSALKYCQHAIDLMRKGEWEKSAKICLFVSTLCSKKPSPNCRMESNLCRKSAKLRLQKKIEESEKFCLAARKICSKNFEILGG